MDPDKTGIGLTPTVPWEWIDSTVKDHVRG